MSIRTSPWVGLLALGQSLLHAAEAVMVMMFRWTAADVLHRAAANADCCRNSLIVPPGYQRPEPTDLASPRAARV
jgi:hypothetical protein